MRTFPAAFFAAALLAAAGQVQAADYLEGHEDLPLLAGLVQDRDSVMVFDTPQGRIVETFAQTRESRETVLAAYAEALPQMGWTRKAPGKFVRDGETLVFEVTAKGPPLVFRILMTAD
jgi:hypothetical protein